MIRTILIATDFSLESLNILKKVLKQKNTEELDTRYNILLVTGYDMGDSIRDLLFNTKGTVFSKIRSKEFCDAYGIIKNKYPHLVNKIFCDVFSGSFQKAFDNYLKAENIQEAYYTLFLKNKNANGRFDLAPYIKKAKNIQVKEIPLEVPESMPERGRLAEVFVEV
ncbi:hypothetical protein [Chryseobacterium chendengshani]|uniref:hypothetical protein n=1 Tax=unclassified Chryseobacterium TaxID=2593645 RepID=UPI001C641581|nr:MULTISPECIES: hypothetical protein [unclassified Chryseobacterium]MBW7675250.1 hypothetical protein [Chryseobacterium sp. LJ756]MBW8522201.1 hypothetical protein [Chryseobacterium sp. LJ668]QYK17845.1 hypothetical protein K0U91_06930 [Chryseobacterium sp. LJ668]